MVESWERRRRLWQHAFFASWLVLTSADPLADRVKAGHGWVAPVALVAGLALWYAVWFVLRTPPSGDVPAPYVIGSGVLWLALISMDTSFLVLGLSVLVPYCLDTVRVWLLAVVACAGSWLWHRATITWTDATITVLIAVSGAAAIGYISSVAQQSAERKRLIDQLQTAQDARATAERQAGVAAERQRLARDLHDGLTQGFASVVMLLEAAEATLPAGSPAARHVGQALRATRENLAESRRVVWALRPGPLRDIELPGALRQLTDRLHDETGTRADTVVTGTAHDLDPHVQAELLRVAQEAVSNIRRHARADAVTVTLSYMNDLTVLDVHDDGTGFDPTLVTGGHGLRTMSERMEQLGGTLLVESTPGEGTTVVATLVLGGVR